MSLTEIIDAVLALVLAGIVGFGVWSYKDRQVKELQTQIAQASLQAEQIANRHTQELVTQKAEADQEKSDAIQKVDASYTSLVASLRSRASRPTRLPSATGTHQASCTGRDLYQQDAEFLAGESARADAVVIERDYYYGQYEAARKLLLSIAGQKPDAGHDGSISDSKPVPGAGVQ